MTKKYFSLLFAFWFLISCNISAQNKLLTLSELDYSMKLKENEKPQLIDVRTQEEFDVEHLENAKNINWNSDNFISTVSKLDKSKPVFVYCKVGGRSSLAGNKLIEMGFKEVYNLDGGIMKWKGKKISKSITSKTGYTLENYNKIINSDKKVLLNFSAKWCAPCKKMAPYLIKMQEELKNDVAIIRLDADENKQLLDELKLDGLPVLLLFENGKETWRNIGYITEQELRKKL
jgi:thioredoxin